MQRKNSFFRDESAYLGIRKILKKLGKHYLPSEAQVNLYRKWTQEWHFSHESIEAAVELTAKGDPNLGYLDGILNGLRQEYGDGASVTPEFIRRSAVRTEGFREVIKELGTGEINPRTLQVYDQMTALYPQKVILLAARECSHSGKDISDILKLLQSWKEKGLESPEEVERYVQAFHDQTVFIRKLHSIWGTEESRISKSDRSMVSKWMNEYGFSKEMILATAELASGAKQPMTYLNKILTDYKEQGVTTPEQAAMARNKSKADGRRKDGRILPAQDFEQRDYSEVPEEMIQDLAREMEAFMKENGGESDA